MWKWKKNEKLEKIMEKWGKILKKQKKCTSPPYTRVISAWILEGVSPFIPKPNYTSHFKTGGTHYRQFHLHCTAVSSLCTLHSWNLYHVFREAYTFLLLALFSVAALKNKKLPELAFWYLYLIIATQNSLSAHRSMWYKYWWLLNSHMVPTRLRDLDKQFWA